MSFTIETRYNAKTMACMARVLRKTVRKKHSRRSHLFGWLVVAFGLLLAVPDAALDFRTVLTVAAVALVLIALLLEDRINGYVARRRMLPGTETAVTVFTESGFVSTTGIGRTEWKYDAIRLVAETDGFFVFVFDASHAQLYDKAHLEGGTVEEFRRFLQSVTGKPVESVS